MIRNTLILGAAIAVLTAGAASAQTAKSDDVGKVGPKQPLPYDQLQAYQKASPKTRATKDWWAGSAATGTSADTSATTPMPTAGATSGATDSSTAATPGQPVNPPLSTDRTTPDASTPPTAPNDPAATIPAPDKNLPGSATSPDGAMPPK